MLIIIFGGKETEEMFLKLYAYINIIIKNTDLLDAHFKEISKLQCCAFPAAVVPLCTFNKASGCG